MCLLALFCVFISTIFCHLTYFATIPLYVLFLKKPSSFFKVNKTVYLYVVVYSILQSALTLVVNNSGKASLVTNSTVLIL